MEAPETAFAIRFPLISRRSGNAYPNLNYIAFRVMALLLKSSHRLPEGIIQLLQYAYRSSPVFGARFRNGRPVFCLRQLPSLARKPTKNQIVCAA